MWQKLKKLKTENKINIFLIIFYSVGVVGISVETTRELFIGLTPFSLLLGIALMFWVHRSWKIKHVLIFAIIALLGFVVELAGVLTGEVFGTYSYGSTLGFKLWGTPPMIGINWLMLIYCTYVLLQKMPVHPILQIFFGAGLMVAYDVVMEPVAIRMDMWDWAGGIIPLQNYIAWFVISIVMLSILHATRLRFRNGVAPFMFFIQMGFFLALNLVLV
jgi:putative membrane protein